jgi:hypothetical protein
VSNLRPATADNLLPAGGGSFLNQVDGNLTAAKTDNTTELHFQGKFRGVDFAPLISRTPKTTGNQSGQRSRDI